MKLLKNFKFVKNKKFYMFYHKYLNYTDTKLLLQINAPNSDKSCHYFIILLHLSKNVLRYIYHFCTNSAPAMQIFHC